MRDLLSFLTQADEAGERTAIAIVTETWGSSPRPVGSMMAVSESGKMAGSVSGGCVEGAVIEAAQEVIQSGRPNSLEFTELKDEDVWAVGLSCGGRIHVSVFPGADPALLAARSLAATRTPFSLEITAGQVKLAELPSPTSREGGDASCPALSSPSPRVGERGLGGEALNSDSSKPLGSKTNLHYPAPERLLIIGGVHIAIPLVAFAKELGFETILIEPRASFADESRFPVKPDQIRQTWPANILGDHSDRADGISPDASTYAVLLTHDPKIDDQALRILLKGPAAYIGCLGSRTTQAQRRERLTAEGFNEQELDRIHGPVGLAIGAKTPAEIALAIMAEITATRRSTKLSE